MFDTAQFAYFAFILIAFGGLAYWISKRYSFPRVALLLIFGFILGISGLLNPDWFDPMAGSDFPLGTAVEITLIIVLFFGGFSINIPKLRGVLRPGVLLATVGTFITASTIAIVMGFAFPHLFGAITAIIIGAIVAPIDPIAVFSAQDTFKLHPMVGTISKFQSGLDDTMVTTITLLICIPIGLQLEATGNASFSKIIWIGIGSFFYLTGTAVLIGVVIGYGFAKLYMIINKDIRPLINIVLPFLTFTVATIEIAPGFPLSSGFVAVFLSGLTFGRMLLKKPEEYKIVHKIWGFGFMFCELFCFILLGALVRIEIFQTIFIPALVISLLIIFVTAPLSIMVCTTKTGLKTRDRLYLSYIGLKGLDPAVLAIAAFGALGTLTNQYVKGIDLLINLTFTVILFVNIGQITMLTLLFGKKGYFTKKNRHDLSLNNSKENIGYLN